MNEVLDLGLETPDFERCVDKFVGTHKRFVSDPPAFGEWSSICLHRFECLRIFIFLEMLRLNFVKSDINMVNGNLGIIVLDVESVFSRSTVVLELCINLNSELRQERTLKWESD